MSGRKRPHGGHRRKRRCRARTLAAFCLPAFSFLKESVPADWENGPSGRRVSQECQPDCQAFSRADCANLRHIPLRHPPRPSRPQRLTVPTRNRCILCQAAQGVGGQRLAPRGRRAWSDPGRAIAPRRTRAWILAACNTTWATRTSSTRCDIPSYRPSGFAIFGRTERGW
jgi:hypothetical protein